jgi:hypothetical protein
MAVDGASGLRAAQWRSHLERHDEARDLVDELIDACKDIRDEASRPRADDEGLFDRIEKMMAVLALCGGTP